MTQPRDHKAGTDKPFVCPYVPPKPKPQWSSLFLPLGLYRASKNLLSVMVKKSYRHLMAKVSLGFRNIFFINAPETFLPVLKDRERLFPKSSQVSRALYPLIRHGSFAASGDEWHRRRKIIGSSYKNIRLAQAWPHLKAAVKGMHDTVNHAAATDKTVDISKLFARVTADVIFRVIFSKPLKTEDAEAVFTIMQAYQDQAPQMDMGDIFTLPKWLRHKDYSPLYHLGDQLRSVLAVYVDERLSTANDPDQPRDIIYDLLQARDEHGEPLDRDFLLDEIGTLFLAGHETTASSLSWAIFMLSQSKDEYEKLRREVAAVFGDKDLAMDHMAALNAVEQCFQETLRLYPPIPFYPRDVMADTPIRRWKVKKGSILSICSWTVHRHTQFWDQPDAFVPGRFDKAGSGEEKGCPYNKETIDNCFIPFSAGLRACPGAGFAMIEGKMILAEFVRHFNPVYVGDSGVMPLARLTTHPDRPLLFKIELNPLPKGG